MKSIIGITANFSYNDEIGIQANLGGRLQQWQLIADDYIKSIEQAGGIPIIIPLYEDTDNIKEIINIIDGIVFTGGNDIDPQYYGEDFQDVIGEIVPERDKQEIELAKDIIFNKKMPVLGICRGNQIINVACGGTLYQDMKKNGITNHFFLSSPKYHGVHDVKIKKDSRLNRSLGKELLDVNSYHHQVVKDVADNLEAVAVTKDGIIEAIEIKDDRFVLGLQWHPEMMATHHEDQRKIFKAFVGACKEYKESK